ncbi:MAG: bifunctional 5,10-methylene-tetrahydrofolate dehydrogenase/5,10-methylene-tetrahydrofolate cyclohydrolase [Bacteroidia bacterium]|nr:bifunctional 5,10-methylene-tetrahydrofolate dehydrogenase/5,10-methylene-tetrahydrofolate cyclohydrolase [Bacteroidia bacterium]
MQLLDGKVVSRHVKNDLKDKVEKRLAKGLPAPHLVAVLVGDDPASASYVRSKVRSCDQVGFKSTLIRKADTISQEELIAIVEELNADNDVDGFIVQLPLPNHIDDQSITLAIDPRKDVDGFHPVNFGRMAQGLPAYIPATPLGILKMLEYYKVETNGRNCVVVGRSNIVGTPMSILLSRKANPGNCTVTLTHSRTKDIKAELLRADIIIAAIGIPHFVKEDMVKEGAVVIDVGINRVEDASRERGYRLVGDVDFDNVAPKTSYITPVPGGVGLMTVASLMLNTYYSAEQSIYQKG